MAMVMYPAVIEKTGEGFAVFFPDLACGGAGETPEEAVADAEQGLAAYLDAAHDTGAEIPTPTPIDKVKVDKDIGEVARVLIRYESPAHAVRVNITMDEALLRRVDTAAEREGFTRSGFLASAVRRCLVEDAGGVPAALTKKGSRGAVGRHARTGSFIYAFAKSGERKMVATAKRKRKR